MTIRNILMGTTAILMATSAANSQSIDYGSLEMMFGEPVTTSATGKPQRQSEAPASMIIIGGEEIRRSGVRTIPDILQNYAGIDVNRYTTGQREMTIRGGNLPYNPRLLVLVNGRQAYLDHYGYTDWNLLGVEMSEIQQLEVVKGPNGALFGFNAVAGVVNIITKNPLNSGTQVSVSAVGGTKDGYQLSASGGFKLGENSALRLSAGMQGEDDWTGIPRATVDPERKNFSGEFISQIGDVFVSAGYTYSESIQIAQAYSSNMHTADSELHGFNASASADTGIGLVSLKAFYNKLDQTVLTINNFAIKNDVLSIKLEDLIKSGTNTFRLGLEYRRNEYEMQNNTAGKTFYDVYAASGMWEWQATEKLTITNAVRLDRFALGHGPINEPLFPRTIEDYDRSYTEWSFNSSLSYALSDTSRIRFSASRGIQVPSLNALGISLITPGVVVAGNPAIEPGPTNSFELAYDKSIASINGSFNLTASYMDANGFSAASQNLPVEPPVNGRPIITEDTVGDFDTYAIEASLRGRALDDKLGWNLNYTWTDVSEDFATDAIEANLTIDEGTPKHKINAVLDFADGPWEAFVAARFRSSTLQRDANGTPPTYADLASNVTIDARLGYRMDNGLSLWVYGENLTSNEAAGLSSVQADSRFMAGVRFDF